MKRPLPSLETLIKNAKSDVHNLRKNSEELAKIIYEIKKMHELCKDIQNIPKQSLCELAEVRGFSKSQFEKWKYQIKFPDIISKYEVENKAIFPRQNKKEERTAFAYLLGVYIYSSKGANKDERNLERIIGNKRMLKNVSEYYTLLTKEKISKSKKRIRIFHARFVRSLEYVAEKELQKYIANKNESVAFLKGFFDTSTPKLSEDHGKLYYCINSEYEPAIFAIVHSCAKLEIYPSLLLQNQKLIIQNKMNLTKLVTYGIVENNVEKKEIKQYDPNTKTEDTFKKYYAVRKKAQELQETKEKINIRKISQEYACSITTVRSWLIDLLNLPETKQTPPAVRDYENVTKYLRNFSSHSCT